MTKTFEDVWSEMTGRQWHAFHMKAWAALGGKESGSENMDRLMAGEIQFAIKELPKRLFDKSGRRIPPRGLKAAVCDPKRDYYYIRPKIDFVDRYVRHVNLFGDPGVSSDDFCERSESLLSKIIDDGRFAGILNGVYLPVILPQLPKVFDYGELMEERFLRAVEKAYRKEYPERKFYDHLSFFEDRNIGLKRQLGSAHPSHNRLIDLLKDAPQLGIFFPAALQGFSADACYEQMEQLPSSFSLSGGIDTAVAMAVYPDVIVWDYHNPNLQMLALSRRLSNTNDTFIFEADGCRLRFAVWPYSHTALGDFSAGLLYLG